MTAALFQFLDVIRAAERALPVLAGLAEALYRHTQGLELTPNERMQLETMRVVLDAGRRS